MIGTFTPKVRASRVVGVPPALAAATYGRNHMPPFIGQLTEEQIRAVSGYIVNDLFKQAVP